MAIINDTNVEIKNGTIFIHTKHGVLAISVYETGIGLNSRSTGTTLQIKQNDFIASVEVIERL